MKARQIPPCDQRAYTSELDSGVGTVQLDAHLTVGRSRSRSDAQALGAYAGPVVRDGIHIARSRSGELGWIRSTWAVLALTGCTCASQPVAPPQASVDTDLCRTVERPGLAVRWHMAFSDPVADVVIAGGIVRGSSNEEQLTELAFSVSGLAEPSPLPALPVPWARAAVVSTPRGPVLLGGWCEAFDRPCARVVRWSGTGWEELPSLPVARAETGGIWLDDLGLVVCGGLDAADEALDGCLRLTEDDEAWQPWARLRTPRHHVSMAMYEGMLAVGGHGHVPSLDYLALPSGEVTGPAYVAGLRNPNANLNEASELVALRYEVATLGCYRDFGADEYCGSGVLEPRGARECRPLAHARDGPAVVLTPEDAVISGAFLVAGGHPSVELWTHCNSDGRGDIPLRRDRFGHTATLTRDGGMVIVGGTTEWISVEVPEPIDVIEVLPPTLVDVHRGRCLAKWRSSHDAPDHGLTP